MRDRLSVFWAHVWYRGSTVMTGAWGAYASSPQRYRIGACPKHLMPYCGHKV